MDEMFRQIPKPVLVFLMLSAAIALFMMMSPPHTICDTQMEVIQKNLQGSIFPTVDKKNTTPPKLLSAKESCQKGNSAGACYEYFSLLKMITVELSHLQPQCIQPAIKVELINKALLDGVEIMARIAWGEEPPGKGGQKLSWFQESEIVTFCRIRNIYERAYSSEEWRELEKKIFPKFPGVATRDRAGAITDQPLAIKTMPELEIWTQSLFSVRCEQFL